MPKYKRHTSRNKVKNKPNGLTAYYREFEAGRNPIVNLFYTQSHYATYAARRFGRNLFWKIYAWFAGIILLTAEIWSVFDPSTKNYPIALSIVDGIILLLFIAGLFAWAYRKRIFKAYVWKFVILAFIADLASSIPYGLKNMSTFGESWLKFWIALFIVFAFILVGIIGIYLYAFKFFPEDNRKNM